MLLPAERRVLVVRDDHLPAWTAPGDAVVCLSYSGHTEETLAVWDEAGRRGLARGAVASGGPLLDRARATGAAESQVPGGLAPRTALGYLIRACAALLGVAPACGWEAAAVHLDRVRDRWERHDAASVLVRPRPTAGANGRGKHSEPDGPETVSLAETFSENLPLLLATEPAMATVAKRWAADLTENAKVPAWVWEFPEAGHNAVMTLASEASVTLPLAPVAIGRPRSETARRRWRALLEVLGAHGATVFEVNEPHDDAWVEAVGLAHAGDWVSVALADRLGANAASLSLMNEFKERLARAAGKDTP
jgi:glucose/mannose-6-phosphate isomerase